MDEKNLINDLTIKSQFEQDNSPDLSHDKFNRDYNTSIYYGNINEEKINSPFHFDQSRISNKNDNSASFVNFNPINNKNHKNVLKNGSEFEISSPEMSPQLNFLKKVYNSKNYDINSGIINLNNNNSDKENKTSSYVSSSQSDLSINSNEDKYIIKYTENTNNNNNNNKSQFDNESKALLQNPALSQNLFDLLNVAKLKILQTNTNKKKANSDDSINSSESNQSSQSNQENNVNSNNNKDIKIPYIADLKRFTHLKNTINVKSRPKYNSFFRKRNPLEIYLTEDIKHYANKSIFIFSRRNSIRLFLFKMIENFYFDIFIICIIILNSIILAFGLSFNLVTTSFDFFDAAEYIFLIIYTIESLSKIIVYGFLEGDRAYLKDPWNQLDFIVMILGLICLFPYFESYKELKIFRTFRPLRSISFLPGLKNLVTTLANSIRQFFHLFMLLLFFFLLYGVLGVTVWAGLFTYRCRESPSPIEGEWKIMNNSENICGGYYNCPENYTCGSITEAYDSKKYFINIENLYEEQDIYSMNYGYTNFDNIGSAFLTIFQCSTLEGWSSIMYMIQNGYNYYPAAIYFISLIIILNYFVLNFTIAIMMDSCKTSHSMLNENVDEAKINKLNMQMRLVNKTDLLDLNLIKRGKSLWRYIRNFKLFKHIDPHYDFHKKWKFCYYAYFIINQPIFLISIYILIIINMINLALIRDDTPETFLETDEITTTKFINFVLVAVFTMESVLKLIGEGFKRFFSKGSNIFDMTIVIISILEVVMFKKTTLSILRVLRIYRLLNILKRWKTLAIIMKCITATVIEMGYYVLLLFIMIYVFALVGMNSFKGAAFLDRFNKPSNNDTGILPKIHFENMYHSMIAVFVLIIGDNWFEIMQSFLRSEKTNNIMVYFYFISVILLMNIIMMNLVVAFLVYIFEVSRKKYHFQEISKQIQEYMKKKKIKTSMSFSYRSNLKIRKMLNDDDKDENNLDLNKNMKNMKKMNKSLFIRRRSTIDIFDLSKLGLDQEKEVRNSNTDKLIKLEPQTSSNNISINKSLEKSRKSFHINKMPNIDPHLMIEKMKSIKVEVENKDSVDIKKFYTNSIKREDFKHYIDMKNSTKEVSKDINSTIIPNPINKKNFEIKTKIIEVDEFSFICEDIESDKDLEQIVDKNKNDNNKVHKYLIIPFDKSDNKNNYKNLSKIETKEESKGNELEKIEKNNLNQNLSGNIIKNKLGSNGGVDINNFVKFNNLADDENSQNLLIKNNSVNNSNSNNFNYEKQIKINNFIQTNGKLKRYNTQVIPEIKIKKSRDNSKMTFIKFISESSLMIFHKTWRIRKFFVKLIGKNWYDNLMIGIIIISNFVILLDSPFNDPEGAFSKTLGVLDDIFTLIFFIEMIMKIIAYGLMFDSTSKIEEIFKEEENLQEKQKEVAIKKIARKMSRINLDKKISNKDINKMNNEEINKDKIKSDHINNNLNEIVSNKNEDKIDPNLWQRAYLRSIFNVFDSFVIITSTIYLFNTKFNNNQLFDVDLFNSIKTLRAMRAMRPLRMINKFTELKLVVKCLIDSLNAIVNMIIIGLFVFFVYAVIGLNLFHGTLGNCQNPTIIYSVDCRNLNLTWTPNINNFDSISSSFLTVFELATSSGWFDVMNQTIEQNNVFASIFFVSFMLIGSVFIMNLSVTVIVDNFITVNEIEEGITMITEEQKEWVKAMKYFLKYKPVPSFNSNNFNKLRYYCYKIISLKYFNNIINIFILLNVIIMCLRFDRNSDFMEDFQTYVFYFFSILFNLELMLKLIAYRKLYFIDVWNKFDFIVVILSNCSIVLNVVRFYMEEHINVLGKFSIIPVMIKSIRILRVFRLLNINENVKVYFYTLLFLFPSLINIGSLVLIILTIYSIIGMNLFGTNQLGDYITENNNFQNFVSSFIFLIRTTTGDDWNQSMHELSVAQPGCLKTQNYESLMKNGPKGCGDFFAFPFFISFVILNSMVIMNLFIAVVVDSFVTNTEKYDAIDPNDIRAFFELWGKYDKNVNYKVEPHEFVLIMMELSTPLGINSDKHFEKFIHNNKKLKGNIYVSYNNLFFVDDCQCMKILTRLNIEAKDDKIHIVDAIKLVTKRAIVADKMDVLDSDNSLQFKEKINELDNIDHERFKMKLNEKFAAYHPNYEKEDKKIKSFANFVMARKVIEKFIKLRNDKKKKTHDEK